MRLLPLLLFFLAAAPAAAQTFEDLTRPYPDSLCTYCAAWDEPQAPVRLHGSTYYVGTRGLSAILVASPEGHVLIDAALPSSAPQILDNIRALGFDPADVRVLLTSHTHFDHVGGLAALQHATGARVVAREPAATDLERGTNVPSDPQYGELLDFAPVAGVERIAPGDTLRVGALALVAHATGGHTPGGTSWSWTSCDGTSCLEVVYADSQTPISTEGFRYSDGAYPDAVADFERGFATLERLHCDLLVTTHPSASLLWDRVDSGTLIDPEACRRYAGAARRMLEERLAKEAEESR